MIYILIFTIVIGLLLAFYNAFIFKMSQSVLRDKHYNDLVHLTGGAIRFSWLIFIIIHSILNSIIWYDTVFLLLVASFVFWAGFNMIYNLILGHGVFYIGSQESGTRSLFDKYIGKLTVPIQGLILLLTILWYPIKLYNIINLQPILQRIVDNPWEWAAAVGFVGLLLFGAYKIYWIKK